MSLSWHSHEVEPCIPVAVDGDPTWCVRIADRAHRKIVNEVARWPTVETGGILVGRLSEAAKTFHVVDVLPAPEDSKRSAREFILGTAGVRMTLSDYLKGTANSLYCVGTWHSHLSASGPSVRDRATASVVGMARLTPSILLIHTPAGYRVVLATSPKLGMPADNQR